MCVWGGGWGCMAGDECSVCMRAAWSQQSLGAAAAGLPVEDLLPFPPQGRREALGSVSKRSFGVAAVCEGPLGQQRFLWQQV